MFRSATFRLTAYYLLIIALISVGFSTALYQVASRDVAHGLERQTQRIIDRFPVFTDSPYLHANPGDLRESRQHLLGRLIALNALVLIAAGFASYGLARRTLRPIEQAHERQKRFTADVSHELRTPLTALKMESEVALLDPKASKSQLRETLMSNVEEVEKLTNLVGDLLRLSQLDDRDGVANLPVISVKTALEAAVAKVQPLADHRGVQLSTELKNGLYVRADQSTLSQLFIILLDNALKYSLTDSLVQVSSWQDQKNVKVSITDSGPGIAKADLDHVFERFYRADQSRANTQASGFGLGLSIAKQIADYYSATINLTSQLGKGTTATVTMAGAEKPSNLKADQKTA